MRDNPAKNIIEYGPTLNRHIRRWGSFILLMAFLGLRTATAGAVSEYPESGPRARGMGEAFTSVADGNDAVFYNPAGLRQNQGTQIHFVYLKPFAGLDRDVKAWSGYGGISMSFRSWGNAAFSWSESTVQGVYRERSLIFSYAHGFSFDTDYFKGHVFAGANGRQVEYGYDLDDRTRNDPVFKGGDSKAYSTFDLGVLYKSADESGVRTGFMLKNADEPDVGFKESVRQPQVYRWGVSYQFPSGDSLPVELCPAFDLDWNVSGRRSYYLGVEAWKPSRRIGVRAGGNVSDGSAREVSLGASYVFAGKTSWDLGLDYAFLYPFKIEDSGGSHVAGIKFQYK